MVWPMKIIEVEYLECVHFSGDNAVRMRGMSHCDNCKNFYED